MTVALLPDTASGQQQWQTLFEQLQIDRDLFNRLAYDIARQDRPIELVARLLSPGRSGARVVLLSYYDDRGAKHDWVLKLVPPGSESKLQIEKDAFDTYVSAVCPHLEVRISLARAMAYSFLQVDDDLRGWMLKCQNELEAAKMIDSVFDRMALWYRNQTPSLRGFFELSSLAPELLEKLKALEMEDLVDMWGRLERRWPRSKGTLTILSHGDLNPTNILLVQDPSAVQVIDFAESGYLHWATDFARLERQLTFVEAPDHAKAIAAVVSSDYYFTVPSDTPPPGRPCSRRHQNPSSSNCRPLSSRANFWEADKRLSHLRTRVLPHARVPADSAIR